MRTKSKLFGIIVFMAMIGLLFAACDNGSSTHTHSFGSWTQQTPATCTAAEVQKRVCSSCGEIQTQSIGNPAGHTFVYWVCNACDKVDGSEFGEALDSIFNIQRALTDPTAVEPIMLAVKLDLGNMQAASLWGQLLTEVGSVGKEVILDLSECTMSGTPEDGTAFDPNASSATTGKGFIIGIVLPSTAKSTRDRTQSTVAFNGFTKLKFFSGANLQTIGKYAFYGLTSLDMTALPAKVTVISDYAFYGCTNLALTSLPGGVKTISNAAFMNCSSKLALTSLPPALETIGASAFATCHGLTIDSITLAGEARSIGYQAFYNCIGITSISLDVYDLQAVFYSCNKLEKVDISENIKEIGNETFRYCTILAEVICRAEAPPSLGTDVFSGDSAALKIYVPADSVDTYKAAANWSSHAAKISAITP